MLPIFHFTNQMGINDRVCVCEPNLLILQSVKAYKGVPDYVQIP